MAVTHISEADAIRDFAALLARVRAGEEVVIEADASPIAIVRSAEPERHGHPISESIALAEAHEKELGYAPVMDTDFAADMEEIIRNRKPWKPPAWE